MNTNNSNAYGTLRISSNVIATIAKSAAAEVEGIYDIAKIPSDLKGMFGRVQPVKPVSVEITDEIAEITVNVILTGGYKIPVVAENVQKSVKESVQSMTGITVSKVNMVVAGVRFPENADA